MKLNVNIDHIWVYEREGGDCGIIIAETYEDALDEAQDEEGFLAVFFRGFEIGTGGAEVEGMTWDW